MHVGIIAGLAAARLAARSATPSRESLSSRPSNLEAIGEAGGAATASSGCTGSPRPTGISIDAGTGILLVWPPRYPQRRYSPKD